MPLDTTDLGQIAAEMMENLAESYQDQDVEVGTVALLVEVRSGDWTAVTFRCSDDRAWVQRGIMREGVRAVDFTQRQLQDDEDGDG